MRPNPRNRRPLVEPLEDRQLLSSTLVPAPDHRAVAYDANREILYIVTSDEHLLRYDVANNTMLDPWTLGFSTAAADITRDGTALYALDDQLTQQGQLPFSPHLQGFVHRVDLTSGMTQTFPFTTTANRGTPLDIAVAANGDLAYTAYLEIDGDGLHSIDDAGAVLMRMRPSTAGDPTAPQPQFVWNPVNYPAYDDDGRTLDYLSRSSGGEQVMATGSETFSHATFAIDGHSGEVKFVAASLYNTRRWSAINAAGTLVAGDGQITDVVAQKVVPLATPSVASAFDPVRPLLYQVNSSSGIEVYDTTTFQHVSEIPVGEPLPVYEVSPKKPSGDIISVAADGSRLFLTTPSGVRIFPLASQPTLLDVPAASRPGVPLTFRVTVQDAGGRVDPGYKGTIHFASSDPSAALPADYTFTSADAGSATFTATLNGSGATSLSLSETAGSSGNPKDDSRSIQVDGELPTAVISGYFGNTHLAPDGFIVHLKDNVAGDASSFGDGDLIVTLPDGTEVLAHLTGKPPVFNPLDIQASYRLDVPGGSWDAADNGVYKVRLAPDALSDSVGNTTDAAQGGITFEVALAADGGSLYRANISAKLARSGSPGKVVSGTALSVRPSLVLSNLDDKPLSQSVLVHARLVEVLRPNDEGTPREEELPDVRQQLDLKPRQSTTVSLDVTVPDSVRAGTYHLVVNVTPETGDVNYDDNNPEGKAFKVADRKEELIAIASPKSITFRDRIQPQAATFLIRNTGNVELTSDYYLTITGVPHYIFRNPLAWSSFEFDSGASSQPLHLTTKPGQTVKMTFNLFVPDDQDLGRIHVFLDGENSDSLLGTDIEDRL